MSPAKPPRIAFFETLPLTRRLRLYGTVAAVALAFHWHFIRLQLRMKSQGRSLPAQDLRRYQLRRRYAAGAAAGYLASRFSLGHGATPRIGLVYADLAALWANFLIAADAAMDTKGLSHGDSLTLLRRCFDALYGPIERDLAPDAMRAIAAKYSGVFRTPYGSEVDPDYPLDHEFRFERYAVATAAAIGRDIARLHRFFLTTAFSNAFATALSELYSRALDLAAGQLASLGQSAVDDDHDWGWYRGVMDRKLVNVLLTPFSLCVGAAAAMTPAQSIQRCFFHINAAFFHRQALDDLMDFEEDLADGVANSLIYMLVSQGRLAEAVQRSSKGEDTQPILQALERCAVPIDATAAVASDESVAALARNALVNTVAERHTPLAELTLQCVARKAALIEAWARHDREAVATIVRQSGIATRILDAIAAGPKHHEIEQALLDLNDESLKEGMYLFYEHTLRTYEKCVRKWRPEGTP